MRKRGRADRTLVFIGHGEMHQIQHIYWPQLKPQQIAPINLIMTNRDFNPPLDCFIPYGVFHTHWLPSRAKYLKCIQQWTYYHLPLNIKWAAFPPRQWYSLDLSIIHILLMSITFLNNIIISYSYSQQKKIKWPMHSSFHPIFYHHFTRRFVIAFIFAYFFITKIENAFFNNHCILPLHSTIKETHHSLLYFIFVSFPNAHFHLSFCLVYVMHLCLYLILIWVWFPFTLM